MFDQFLSYFSPDQLRTLDSALIWAFAIIGIPGAALTRSLQFRRIGLWIVGVALIVLLIWLLIHRYVETHV